MEQHDLSSSSSFVVPWLSELNQSLASKDDLIPRKFTILGEKEALVKLEPFELNTEQLKKETLNIIKGNNEEGKSEAEIRVKSEEGSEVTKLTQNDLDDFFSN